VVLRRTTWLASLWAVVGLGVVAAAVWFVDDSGGDPVAWVFLAMVVVTAGWFLVQALVPMAVEVRLGPERLRARALWIRHDIPWDAVHVAWVRRAAGDPILRLELREPHPRLDGEVVWRSVGILLPVGVDLTRLHRFLAARLGAGPGAQAL